MSAASMREAAALLAEGYGATGHMIAHAIRKLPDVAESAALQALHGIVGVTEQTMASREHAFTALSLVNTAAHVALSVEMGRAAEPACCCDHEEMVEGIRHAMFDDVAF